MFTKNVSKAFRGRSLLTIRCFSHTAIIRQLHQPPTSVEAHNVHEYQSKFLEASKSLSSLKLYNALSVGDLVEVRRRRSQVALGILIKVPQPRGYLGGFNYQTVLSNGHTILHNTSDVSFRFPQWCFSSPILRRPIPGQKSHMLTGMSSETSDILQRLDIPMETLHHLARFQEMIKTYGYEKRETLKHLHQREFVNKETGLVDLLNMTKFVFKAEIGNSNREPTSGELYTVHSYLRSKNLFYEELLERVGFNAFAYRDKHNVKEIQWLKHQLTTQAQVKDNLKRSESPQSFGTDLDSFIAKCRELIAHNRQQNPTTNNTQTPASELSPEKITFTKSDWIFINAIRQYISESRSPTPYQPLVLLGILKMLEPLYPAFATHTHAIQLMKEIGVWAPWENVVLLSALNGRTSDKRFYLEGSSEWAEKLVKMSENYADQVLAAPGFDDGLIISKNDTKFAVGSSNKVESFESNDIKEVKKVLQENPDPIKLVDSQFSKMDDKLYVSDECAPIRRDFGDIPVYVIDDPSAHELDDGISIESLPNGDVWLHVHIADPTTYIPPHHPISLFAQLRGTSIYLPERHYPMMPEVFAQARFDLGASSFALTFSARISDTTGDVVDYKVTPSIVRNLQFIPYKAVDGVLPWDSVYGMQSNPETLPPWVIRHLSQNSKTYPDQLPPTKPETIAELNQLFKVISKHHKFRINRGGGFNFDQPGYSIKIEPYPIPITTLNPIEPANFFSKETPVVTLNPNDGSGLSPSHILVSESMIIAGRVAAKFAFDRNIPVPYRGQPSIYEQAEITGSIEPDTRLSYKDGGGMLEYAVDPMQFFPVRNVLERDLNEAFAVKDTVSGVVPFEKMQVLGKLMPGSTVGMIPHSHFAMGLPGFGYTKQGVVGVSGGGGGCDPGVSDLLGYVKVTSPLRRYKDLLTHWQIKSWLMAEHGKSKAELPFTFDEIQEISENIYKREKRVRTIQRSANKFWGAEWIRRREYWWRSGRQEEIEGPGRHGGMGDSRWWKAENKLAIPSLMGDLGEIILTASQKSPVYTAVVINIKPDGNASMVWLDEAGGLVAKISKKTQLKRSIGDRLRCVVSKASPSDGGILEVEVVE